MVIINKKRISIMLCCILMGLFTFFYSYQETKDETQTIQVTATPVSGKIVVLDAGHGVPDERDCLLTLIENN